MSRPSWLNHTHDDRPASEAPDLLSILFSIALGLEQLLQQIKIRALKQKRMLRVASHNFFTIRHWLLPNRHHSFTSRKWLILIVSWKTICLCITFQYKNKTVLSYKATFRVHKALVNWGLYAKDNKLQKNNTDVICIEPMPLKHLFFQNIRSEYVISVALNSKNFPNDTFTASFDFVIIITFTPPCLIMTSFIFLWKDLLT